MGAVYHQSHFDVQIYAKYWPTPTPGKLRKYASTGNFEDTSHAHTR